MRGLESMWQSFKRTFIGDRAFYAYILRLAIPMIIQNAVTNFVSFLDNIMVGQIGTEQMSGVAIVNQLIFVFNLCIFGGVSGAGIFGTQYYGKGDYEGQKYAFRFKLYIGIAASAAALLLFGTRGTELISLYLNDTGGVGDIGLALQFGESYLAIMMLGLAPYALGQIYTSSIRETGQTFVPMVASATAVAVNLVLDYVLIFGPGPVPALGVEGAAIATVIARFAECLLVVIWTHRNPDKNQYIIGAYRSLTMPRKVFKDIFIKGMPLLVNELLWASGVTVVVQCYAVRGLEVVAAQNISTTITNLFNIFYMQLGACIAIVIGQLLGAGKIEEAKEKVVKILFFTVACGGILGLLMAFFGRYFPELYNTEPEIKMLAKQFIVIAALAMPLFSFCHGSYFTLRSGGKTGITFLFDCGFTWCIMIPVAYALVNFTELPVVLVFLCVQSTELIKVVMGFFMVRSGIWIQNIVEE